MAETETEASQPQTSSSSSSSLPSPITPTTSPASSSAPARHCTRYGCKAPLPALSVHPYLQCASCREYGRRQHHAFQERKRRRLEEANAKVEGVEGSVMSSGAGVSSGHE